MGKIFYNGPSYDKLFKEYAQKGLIDEKAAIKSSFEGIIKAPIAKVWDILFNFQEWPRIDPSFSEVKLESTVSAGARMSFKSKGFQINAKFAVVNPENELTWVGRSLWTKGIDRHVLQSMPDGNTKVYFEESISGFFVPLLYSSETLHGQQKTLFESIEKFAFKNSYH